MEISVLDGGRLVIGGPRVTFVPPCSLNGFYMRLIANLGLTREEAERILFPAAGPSVGEDTESPYEEYVLT